MDRLAGRVAIVTGGAAGIGAAIARAFAAEGARVVIADRDEDNASETAASLPDATAIGTDVTHEDDVRALVAATLGRFGSVDILVNNAGIMRKGYVKDMPLELWQQVLDVNLTGTFLCSKAVLPAMIERRRGRIINIASIAGKIGEPTASAYSAAKFGVIGFTRALAHEVARHDILVNAICPGPIATALGEQGWREGAEVEGVALDRVMARVNARSPLGRLGTVDSVARMALFVASDDCDFTTGAAFNVDGGIVMA
ncbi:MAG TPA: SDR family NAD(P)-dependent oxidoreductase [Casimicrobiaceae bacterium]|jgi:NAD(P)-dependent dehydrogenase (short-subunit alcohol dehydrogenase family)